jgi:O-glycosyl hydrolase
MLWLVSVGAAVLAADVTIEVSGGPQQTFGGLGVNVNEENFLVGQSADVQKQYGDLLWGPGRFTLMRLWAWGGSVPYTMVRNGVERGVSEVLLACHECRGLQDHANFYVGTIERCRADGINITAVGFQNKPNTSGSGSCLRAAQDVAEGVKIMRETLDARGLEDVKLIAPETVEWWPRRPEESSKYDFVEGSTVDFLGALVQDFAAVAALDAFATETYGTGVTTEMQELVAPFGKQYWQTLGATDPISWDTQHSDPCLAPVSAAQFLSDLNHGVTHWFHWDISQVLSMGSSFSSGPFGFYPRYYFYTALSSVFDVGAVVRPCTSDPALPSADMHFNYTKEPLIVASAAHNPDKSFAVALVNLTGLHSQHYSSYYTAAEGATLSVSVVVDGLKSAGRVVFSRRSCVGAATETRDREDVVMEGGEMTLDVASLELSVLRSEVVDLDIERHEISRRSDSRTALRASAGANSVHVVLWAGAFDHVEVVDMQGHVLLRRPLVGSCANVPCGRLSSGVYLMRACGSQGVSAAVPLTWNR